MSRVYEALRRAEGQRAVEEQPKDESASAAETVRQLSASRLQIQTDSGSAGRLQTKAPLPVFERIKRCSNPTSSAHTLDTVAPSEGSPYPLAPYANRASRGPLLVVGHREYPAVAEQFHRLSLSLQNWATENDKRVFTIISALSQDGKSFVAVNLAASLAMRGIHVILIDADLRQPVLHNSLSTAQGHGLIDYLKGEAEFRECLQPTGIPKLLLAPAGGISYTPAELLGNTRMQDFIREGRSLNPAHYIVIDSPASSLVPEPEIFNRLGDASLVVVAANRTPRELVKQTIKTVGKATVFGLVLNRYEPPHSAIRHYPDRYALKHNPGMGIPARTSSVAERSQRPMSLIRSLVAYFKFAVKSHNDIG